MQLAKIATFLFLIGFFCTPLKTAFAQASDPTIVTWEANNFYPADFEGKPQATFKTPITVSVEVVRAGKLLNITGTNIAWYVDDSFMDEGIGKKSITFNTRNVYGSGHLLKIQIERTDGTIEVIERIPVAKPRVVIEIPYLNSIISAQSKVTIKAIPYFFTNTLLSGLKFSWDINGSRQSSVGDNVLSLNVGTPQTTGQQTLLVTGTIQNNISQSEFSNTYAKLYIQ